MKKWLGAAIAVTIALSACKETKQEKYRTTGFIERFDPAFDSLVSKDAKIEIIAEGLDWAEGPLWLPKQNMLIFSDVPQNKIYKWTEEKGKEIYLTPSGYTDTVKRGGETGSNGLTLDTDGKLVLCQCGNRQVARMNAPLDQPVANFTALANNYNSKKFNSPNDLVFNNAGELFFTDPPYGLEKYMDDPKKELPFQGVFKVKANGAVVLLTDTLTRPNGIAFFPNSKTILIANSDPDKANWYAYDMKDDQLTNGRILLSANGSDKKLKGSPDGMKIDRNGNVYSAGPGGIWIFTKEGKLLGKLRVNEATSNCAFSPDEKTLYITNDMNVLRVKLRP